MEEQPLFEAYRNGSKDIINYLKKHEAIMNEEVFFFFREDLDVNDSLITACSIGNKSIVNSLIKLGANINKFDYYKTSSLVEACCSGNEAIVEYLVQHGANVNQKGGFNKTPLLEACRYENEAIVKYLVKQEADVITIKIKKIYDKTTTFCCIFN